MPRKRYNAEEIIHKLRESDVLLSQGKTASRPPRLESGPVEGTLGRGVPQTVPRACPLDVPGSWLIQLPPDGVTLRTYE